MTLDPEGLLAEIRAGGGEGLGALLERYRTYLSLLARTEIGRRLQGKLDASDLVQETFLEAHKHFPGFQGGSEAQFLRWLRTILAARVANLLRHYLGTQGRDVRLERDLENDLEKSSICLTDAFVAAGSTPSQLAARREQSVVIAEALGRLPEDYRQVLVLRHL